MQLPTAPDATEVQPLQTGTEYVKAGMKAKESEEIWNITVPGTVQLRILTPNRFGQMVDSEMAMGPGRAGQQATPLKGVIQRGLMEAIYGSVRTGRPARVNPVR